MRFGGDLSFRFGGSYSLEEIDFLKNGFDTLAPASGKGFTNRISGIIKPSNVFDVRKQTHAVITVAYEDSVRNKYTDEFRFDFSDRIYPND